MRRTRGVFQKLLSQGTTLRRFTFKTVSKRSNLPLDKRRFFESKIIQRAKAPSFSMCHRSDCMNVREDQDRTGDTMLGLCQKCPKNVSGIPFLSSKCRRIKTGKGERGGPKTAILASHFEAKLLFWGLEAGPKAV